jgi:hypothetical protein
MNAAIQRSGYFKSRVWSRRDSRIWSESGMQTRGNARSKSWKFGWRGYISSSGSLSWSFNWSLSGH